MKTKENDKEWAAESLKVAQGVFTEDFEDKLFRMEMEREAMHIQKIKTYGLIFLGAMLMLLAAFIFTRLT